LFTLRDRRWSPGEARIAAVLRGRLVWWCRPHWVQIWAFGAGALPDSACAASSGVRWWFRSPESTALRVAGDRMAVSAIVDVHEF
jgi:hypothetical protein